MSTIITTDMAKAKEIHRARIRSARSSKFAELDNICTEKWMEKPNDGKTWGLRYDVLLMGIELKNETKRNDEKDNE